MDIPFFEYQAASIARYFKSARTAKIITTVLFVLVFLFVAVGVFFFFRRGFAYIAQDPFLYQVVSLYVYEIFFLMVGALIFFSALIAGYFALFHNETMPWIMASPRYRLVPLFVLWRTLLVSIWPMLLIGLPALLALRSIAGISIQNFVLAVIAIIILSSFAVVAAMALLIGIGALLMHLGRLLSVRLLTTGWIVTSFIGLFLLGSFAFNQVTAIDFEILSQPKDLTSATASLDGVISQFKGLPSHYAALSLLRLQQGDAIAGLSSLGSLTVITLIAIGIFVTLSYLSYLPLWQGLQEGHTAAGTGSMKPGARKSSFPRYGSSILGTLFEKEALLMLRNKKSMLWSVFLLFIWVLQLALNVTFRENFNRYGLDESQVPLIFQAFQIVVMIYFVSAFVLRFGFPSMSVERKTVWILGSAPINLVNLFWAKLWFYTAAFTTIGLVVGLANAAILTIPVIKAALFLAIAITALVVVSVIGISFGALFPNFETDDPSILSTSLPGLGFIVVSLLYGVFAATAYYFVLARASWIPFILFAVISVAVTFYLPYAARKKIPFLTFVSVRE